MAAAAANADVISLLGDKDCFGLGGSCPDGSRFVTDLGGAFFTSYQDPGDPAFTDDWTTPGSVSYTHTYALPGDITSAVLELKIAGIADISPSPYTVMFNGVGIGTIPFNTDVNAYQAVLTYDFNVPIALLSGADTIYFGPTGGDGFIVDYSQLDIATIPEPGTLALLGTGLIGLASRLRRKLS